MKIYLYVLLGIVLLPVALFFLAPSMVKGPYTILSQIGITPAPNVFELYPEQEDLPLVIAAKSPAPDVMVKIVQAFESNVHTLVQSEALEADTKGFIEELLGSNPRSQKKENLDSNQIKQALVKMRSSPNFMNFPYKSVIAIGINNQKEQNLNLQAMSFLSSFRLLASVSAPLNLPSNLMLLAPNDIKKHLLKALKDTNFLQQKNNNKGPLGLLEKMNVKKTWVSLVPVLELSHPILTNLKLYITALSKSTVLLSSDKDLLSSSLASGVRSMAGRSNAAIQNKMSDKTLLLNFNFSKMVKALGPMGLMAQSFVGSLNEADFYGVIDSNLKAGGLADFKVASDAIKQEKKLQTWLRTENLREKFPMMNVLLKRDNNKLSLNFSLTADSAIQKLNEITKEKIDGIKKEWQMFAGLKKLVEQRRYSIFKLKTKDKNLKSLSLMASAKMAGGQNSSRSKMLKNMILANMKTAFSSSKTYYYSGGNFRPKFLVLNVSCKSKNVNFSIQGIARGKSITIPTKPLYSQEQARLRQKLDKKEQYRKVLQLNAQQSFDGLRVKLDTTEPSLGCNEHSAPFIVAI